MNDYEFTVVESAISRTLISSAPGISDTMRGAIIRSIVMRIRHELKPAKLDEAKS